MAYTKDDFIAALALYTAGAVIGIKNTGKFAAYAGRKGIQLAGLGIARAAPPVASGIGGLANWAVKKKIRWRDLILAILVGWAAAEFFIPPIMKHWTLDVTWGPAIAFLIGFCGIRLLPVIEQTITSKVKGS